VVCYFVQNSHPDLLPSYLQHKDACHKESENQKMKNREFRPHDRIAKRPKKLLKLDQVVVSVANNMKPTVAVSQQTADKLILRFIVDSLSPLSHVEHPSFLALVHGLAPHINVCSHSTLSRRIFDESNEMTSHIKEVFQSTSSVCLTADAWSGFRNGRSFLGLVLQVMCCLMT
jgi:hypothetical protein